MKCEIFVTSHVQIFFFLLKWTNSGKEVIYGKKNGGHRVFKSVKSLRSSQSDCLFALSRHCVTFPRRPGSTAIPWCHTLSRSILMENVCIFSIVFTFVVCDAWRMRDIHMYFVKLSCHCIRLVSITFAHNFPRDNTILSSWKLVSGSTNFFWFSLKTY